MSPSVDMTQLCMTKLFLSSIIFSCIVAFGLGVFTFYLLTEQDRPTYSSGWYEPVFYEGSYARADGQKVLGANSGLVAHHLLVADKIAEVFETLASDEAKTVVIVSPNHFGRGLYPIQVSKGQWVTPFGTVRADDRAIGKLLEAYPRLHHEEAAYTDEHGIYGLMPFVAKSFPNARVVPILVREDLLAAATWELGRTIARELPNAVFLASVDMTHYQDADYTAQNDAMVLTLLAEAGNCNNSPCETNLDIDSNSSLRVLFGFNSERGTQVWNLTHHGSSLAMGAAQTPADNTSHILGYFFP